MIKYNELSIPCKVAFWGGWITIVAFAFEIIAGYFGW